MQQDLRGRMLTKYTIFENQYYSEYLNYKYNDAGIRTSKIRTMNSGVTLKTDYIVKNGLVVKDIDTTTVGSTTYVPDEKLYKYDASGSVTAIKLLTHNADGNVMSNEWYFYKKNLQGDVIGLVDKTGTQVVAYVYDSWGKLITTTDTSGVSLGWGARFNSIDFLL